MEQSSSEDGFTTGETNLTPSEYETHVAPSEVWNGRTYSVPWSGNTYIIFLQNSNKAISVAQDGDDVFVREYLDIIDTKNQNFHWQCVERQGYFGFTNAKTGAYIGHNNCGDIVARARKHNGWESIVPRCHPTKGFQLLLPCWSDALTVMTLAKDGHHLANRNHGTTVWEFMKV